MRITVIGRGSVGGGLGRLWQAAGHEVIAVGRDGGDASGSDALLVAVPSGAIDDALNRVTGIDGIPAIDATNGYGRRAGGFDSLAHQVKSLTQGPVAKAFNTNFAALFDELPKQRVSPSCIYCGDDGAKEICDRLIRDAGYEPVFAGGLQNARPLEDFLQVIMGIAQSETGRFFYRIASPGEL
jgi:predicted dinucleotide-binding enzyme